MRLERTPGTKPRAVPGALRISSTRRRTTRGDSLLDEREIFPGLSRLAALRRSTFMPPPRKCANRVRINALAQEARVPTMHGFREYVDAGGIVSYGPNTADLFKPAAEYVDKILRGAKPANLPVEQPTKFDLVINLKIAKALGVDIPPSLLTRADEVLE